MDTTAAIVPVISVGIFIVVLYKAITFFIHEHKKECEFAGSCASEQKRECREGDKAVVACVATASVLYIIAQSLEWLSTGFNPPHSTYMHAWHDYDFVTAVIWLLFVYHLRARSVWRSPR